MFSTVNDWGITVSHKSLLLMLMPGVLLWAIMVSTVNA